MKMRILILGSLVLLAFNQLKAQDDFPTAPPSPLDHEFLSFLVGEWEGSTESIMGTSTDWSKYEMALGGQFLMMQGTYDFGGMKYEGRGYLTINDEGGMAAAWIDNFRGRYAGSGTIEDNKITVNWEGNGRKSTRVTEKSGNDEITIISKDETPQGTMESKSVYTRKTTMGKK